MCGLFIRKLVVEIYYTSIGALCGQYIRSTTLSDIMHHRSQSKFKLDLPLCLRKTQSSLVNKLLMHDTCMTDFTAVRIDRLTKTLMESYLIYDREQNL